MRSMKSVTHSQTFRMDRPAADLFPLFSPEGEKKWVPGWDYENLTGTTGLSEDKVGVITVTCIEDGPAKARVSVTYTYKALSESGERFISEFDAAAYAAFIDEWRTCGNRGLDVRWDQEEKTEYVAVCLPAFSPDTIHRDE